MSSTAMLKVTHHGAQAGPELQIASALQEDYRHVLQLSSLAFYVILYVFKSIVYHSVG